MKQNLYFLVQIAEQHKDVKVKIKLYLGVGEHKDPEIQAEISKGNTVNILYDSSY